MFDYRLFFANTTLDSSERERRPLLGHDGKRVYRLTTERREQRSRGHR